MEITIKEVAAEAGVSVATVSRVINGGSGVSKESADKVNRAIQKLGYSPNRMARSLRKSETNLILAVMPTFETPFYGEIVRGMQEAAVESGYNVMACMSGKLAATEKRLLKLLTDRAVDAAVMLGTVLDADTLNELNRNFNLALCLERLDNSEVLTVTVDDVAGAYTATKNFIDCGHRDIAMISTSMDSLFARDREYGYSQALIDNNIEYRKEYMYHVQYGTHDSREGGDAFDKFFALEKPPSAVFCISDLLAYGFMRQALRRGYKIGEDVSVCGFDNLPFSGMYNPSLTTVEQPRFEIGRTVVEELIYNMQNGKKNKRLITLNFNLITRESVKPYMKSERMGGK